MLQSSIEESELLETRKFQVAEMLQSSIEESELDSGGVVKKPMIRYNRP